MAVVEYDGTAYHGFQVQSAQLCDQASTGSVQQQPALPTIQGEIERALASVTQECIRIAGAGRTDAGVHALGQVISFRTGWGRSLEELHRAVNARLAKDIGSAQPGSGTTRVPCAFQCPQPALSLFNLEHGLAVATDAVVYIPRQTAP